MDIASLVSLAIITTICLMNVNYYKLFGTNPLTRLI